MNSENKTCQNCRGSFVIEPDDFGFYEKMKVPPPTFCPDCRWQRRMLFRNERSYYKRKCDLCKKDIISSYSVNVPFPVYCQKCFWGEGWNAYDYGRDFDFSASFFPQFKELFLAVPQISIMNDNEIGSVNSEYAYDFSRSKNCYMTAAGWFAENVMYSYYTCHVKDIMDSTFINNCELIYECFNVDKCYRSKYCSLCFDCVDCAFGYDLKGCSNCVLCVGLRNKQYHILNKPYSKEEYEKKAKELRLGDSLYIEKHKATLKDMMLKHPHKFADILKSVNTTGTALIHCKASKVVFFANDLENCKFMFAVDGAKECYDCFNTGKPNFCYDCVVPDMGYGNKFSIFCWVCNHVEYSNNCHGSSNLFGCSGVKNGEYAILNKKYSKEEYEKLRAKIVEHMKSTSEYGEFFPGTMSVFAYNESQAQEWFPLEKKQAIAKGYTWKDPEPRNYKITLEPDALPFTIQEVSDDILKDVIRCAHNEKCTDQCTGAFKIILPELQLYRKMDVPLPKLCPNCRHYERIRQRSPLKLWHRTCMCDKANHEHSGKCPNEFETPHAPDRKEIIYCEECYNAEVA